MCSRTVRQRRGDAERRARDIYGVVLDAGAASSTAPRPRRCAQTARRGRVERARKPRAARLAGPVALRITDNLVVRIEGDGPHHACAKCDADLGPTRDNYKDHCDPRGAPRSRTRRRSPATRTATSTPSRSSASSSAPAAAR